MASPSARSQIVTNGTSASATPAVNLPATIRAGDTLWVVLRNAAAGSITFPAGWTQLIDASPDGAVGQVGIAWRKADGTEGATITCGSGNGKFAAVAYAIQDAADPTIRPPELSTVQVGTTGQPDPTTVTPTGGSKDYLFLTFYTMEGEQTGVTSYPTGYTGAQLFANSGTAGAVTTNATIGSATKAATAASDDAGAWTVAGALDDSSNYTAAFHPASVVPAPLSTGDELVEMPWRRKAPVVTALTFTLGLLQSTLGAPAPFAQSRWDVPARPKTLFVTTATRPAVDAATPTGDPFRLADWRVVPPRPRQLLVSTSTRPSEDPVITAAPFTQTAWPLPVRIPARVQGLHAFEAFYVYDDTTPFTPSDGPRIAARDHRPIRLTHTQNLLQSTLTPAEAQASPVATIDWALPRGSRAALRTDSSNLLATGLLREPFTGIADPLPAPRRVPVATERTSSALTTRLLEEPIAGRATELPRPWMRPQLPRDADNRLATGLLAEPVAGRLQGLPEGRPSAGGLRTSTAPASTLAGQDAFFAAAGQGPRYDYPNPQGKPYPVALRTWTLGLQTTTLPPSTDPPFVPVAFDNPRGKAYPVALRTHLETRRLGLHNDLVPTNQTDWPVPVRPVRVPTLTWTQTAALQPAPLVPGSWPLPLGRPVLVGLSSWLGTRQPYHVDLTPAALTDWPNPQGPAYPIHLRTHATNLLETTLAPAPMPFGLSEWPNPQGPTASRTLRTHAQAVVLELVGQDVFFGEPGRAPSFDWPNPRGRSAAIDLRTLTFSGRFPVESIGSADVVTAEVNFSRDVTASSTFTRVVTADGPFVRTVQATVER